MNKMMLTFVILYLIAYDPFRLEAGQKATKQECIMQVQEAVGKMSSMGIDAGLNEINNKNGKFVWKDSYVFCIEDKTAKLLAHPFVPDKLIGKSFIDVTDKAGKPYFKEFLTAAEDPKGGWVDYIYPNEKGVPAKKIAYVLKAPGKSVILVAGIFADVDPSISHYISPLMDKKLAYIVCYNGFEDDEYKKMSAALKAEGIQTTFFSSQRGIAKGMYGTQLKIDHLIDEIRVEEFDAVVFASGRGVQEFIDNPKAHKIAQKAAQLGKVVSANYWAPLILSNADILQGKKATVIPAEADRLMRRGSKYTGKKITVDGNIITANGSASSELYGKVIIAKLLVDSFR